MPAAQPVPTVLVPLRSLVAAKSRLGIADAGRRRAVTTAMTSDVVAAALASGATVTIVSDDPEAVALAAALGAGVHPDAPGGLDAAMRAAAAAVAGPVAVVMADLPCLDATGLAALWRRSAGLTRWVVADAEGSGTAVLGADSGPALAPSYGPGSRARHAAGAIDLSDEVDPRLRRDVDQPDDLAAAVALGVGPSLSALLASGAVHLGLP